MLVNCVICSDFLQPSANIYATPCGHVFHHHCLSQWMERSKSCPQCRNKANNRNIIRIYLNYTTDLDASLDSASLMQKLDNAQSTINDKESEMKKIKAENESFKTASKKSAVVIKELESKNTSSNLIISQYRKDVQMLKICRDELNNAQKEVKTLQQRIKSMETIDSILQSSVAEVEETLKNDGDPNTLAVLIVALKRELKASEVRKNELRGSLKAIHNDLRNEQNFTKKLEEKLSFSDSEINRLMQELKKTEGNGMSSVNDMIVLSDSDGSDLSPKVDTEQKAYSPYLRVKSSSIGLSPLSRFNESKKTTAKPSLRADMFSIFKKPRLSYKTTQNINPDIVFNGIGGSEKKENFPSFSDSFTRLESGTGPVRKKMVKPLKVSSELFGPTHNFM